MFLELSSKHDKLPDEWTGFIDLLAEEKPIILPKGQKAYMDLLIEWKDNTHADPENVFGSIADALFLTDKDLCGSFDVTDKRGEGLVHVRITV